MRHSWTGVLLLLSACAATGPAAVEPGSPLASAEQRPGALVPTFDHHQHLLSEGARKVTLDWIKGWPLESVELPPEIERVIVARQAAWNDKAGLAALLHEEAVMRTRGVAGWIKGRDAAAGELARLFGRPYRMSSVAWGQDGSSAYVAGYYTRGEGSETAYVGFFHVDLIRSGGAWKIIGETPQFPGPEIEPLVDADLLVKMLDGAGIDKALVFSNAYYFARGPSEQPGEYERVKAETDWTLAQVRRHPTRLYAACSVNPLRAYAVAEVERCHATGAFKALKLHFDGSSVDLKNPAHLASVKTVFATANRLRIPLIVHLQSEAG